MITSYTLFKADRSLNDSKEAFALTFRVEVIALKFSSPSREVMASFPSMINPDPPSAVSEINPSKPERSVKTSLFFT